MSSFTIDGIASGFDTTSIIESLVGFQDAQIGTFNQRKADVASEQTAFKGIEAQLITLQSTLGKLGRSRSSVFSVKTATSSNEDVLQVAAGSKASPGTYNLSVESLATANQIGSQGFTSSSDTLATGEITIALGNSAATTITIDETNNTLSGVVEAINENVEDVNASIIFDQGADSYRVLLSGNETGAENTISITSNPTDGGTTLDFSGTAIQEAANAVVKLGSGPGAITASYSSNIVDGLIDDVTLDLKSADPGTNITVNIANDNEAAKEAVRGFVDSFNAAITFIDNQTSFDAGTGQASVLLGDRNVSRIKNSLTSFVIESVAGLTGANRLSDVGIDIDIRGKLTFDESKLEDALNGEVEGLDPENISRLFGLDATSSNSGISFIAGSDRTIADGNKVEVNITQAAERAQIVGSNELDDDITIDGTNNEFQITLNSIVSETLTIPDGDYTTEEFVDTVQNLINNSTKLGVNDVIAVVDEDGILSLTSELYGDDSTLSSFTGSAASELGFTGAERSEGKDVEGEFIIDGVVEVATGNGQVLRGDSENELTADLQLRVTLEADDVVAGNESSLVVTRGASGRLSQYIGGLLNSETGRLSTINEEYDARIESIDRSIEGIEELTASKRESLLAEFAALETIINELKTTGDFLTSQFSALSASQG
jgi:flagellar hook-associated protein 2